MRIGVFSDSHGDISYARRFFDRMAPLDCIFHLGDYASDGGKLSKLLGCPLYAVRGNCDYRSGEPLERQMALGGKRICCSTATSIILTAASSIGARRSTRTWSSTVTPTCPTSPPTDHG